MSTENDPKLNCSFCGKTAEEVKKLIAGPEVYICDECVGLCHNILANNDKNEIVAEISQEPNCPTPRMIKDHLDQYVIGQDSAKTILSIAVYNHYRRLENPIYNGIDIEKSNLIIAGPTASGKTFLAQSIAKYLDVPIAISDATSLTEAGYVGEDVESIIGRLLQAAGGDVAKAEKGIVFIDEIDKIAGQKTQSNARDISGEGVQQALLKLLEGSEIMVPPLGKKNGDAVKVNTKNILFMVAGSFVGLDKIVGQSNAGSIGFGAKVGEDKISIGDSLRKIEPEHLVKFGMIPELIGRLPIYVSLDELTEDQLVQVLVEPKNSLIKQFEARFSMDSVKLEFTKEALQAIAKQCVTKKVGARGLRSIVEACLQSVQFELPEYEKNGIKTVTVSESTILNKEKPILNKDIAV